MKFFWTVLLLSVAAFFVGFYGKSLALAATPPEHDRPYRPTIVGEVDQGPPLYRWVDGDISCYLYSTSLSCVRN